MKLDSLIDIDSPDKAVIQSYYNNSGLTSKAAQYSQVSVKQIENSMSQTNNDYANNELGALKSNNMMNQSSGFMMSRTKKGNQVQFKQINNADKKKSKSIQGGAKQPNYKNMASIIFDDVYNTCNPDKMLTRIANN